MGRASCLSPLAFCSLICAPTMHSCSINQCGAMVRECIAVQCRDIAPVSPMHSNTVVPRLERCHNKHHYAAALLSRPLPLLPSCAAAHGPKSARASAAAMVAMVSRRTRSSGVPRARGSSLPLPPAVAAPADAAGPGEAPRGVEVAERGVVEVVAPEDEAGPAVVEADDAAAEGTVRSSEMRRRSACMERVHCVGEKSARNPGYCQVAGGTERRQSLPPDCQCSARLV